ncbi:MAG TPA: hypothetical protein VLX68_13945 [Chitinivibrionales bacterium]|nr:hypothetical protein [Chitinivibrionales bacterium]
MDAAEKIKKMVLAGHVLDDEGAWVPLGQRSAVEKKILGRLMAGKVLSNGHWVPISQALETARKEGLAPPPETKAISRRRPPRGV